MRSRYDIGNLTNVDIYRMSISTADLREIRAQLADTANKRLRRLSKATSAVTGEKLDTFGAAVPVRDYLDKAGRNWFSQALSGSGRGQAPLNRRELQHEIVVLQSFLNAKTSSVSGQRKAEKKRINTFTKRGIMGAASNKQFYDFLNSETYKNLKRTTLDSEAIQDQYSRMYDAGMSPEDIEKAFKEYEASGQEVTFKGLQDYMNAKIMEK